MTEAYFRKLQQVGYVGVEGMVPCGEVAMSMLLTTDDQVDHLAELAGIRMSFRPSQEQLQQQLNYLLAGAGMTKRDIGLVLTGMNGNPANDQLYKKTLAALNIYQPQMPYKQLFGEHYTVSALGLYAAAHLLKAEPGLHGILLLNQTLEGDSTLMLIKN